VTYSKTGTDSAGKMLFPSTSLMMREKVNIYKQFSSLLLGDPDGYFVAPFDSTTTTDRIDEAFFICFKRLFHRDRIKRETFALRWYTTGSSNSTVGLHLTSYSGSATYTDVGSSTNKLVSYGGNVGNIINSANTAETVGLMFYDKGIAVLDLKKIISTSEEANGVISAVNNTAGSSPTWAAGQTPIGITGKSENPSAKYIPDFVVSASNCTLNGPVVAYGVRRVKSPVLSVSTRLTVAAVTEGATFETLNVELDPCTVDVATSP
jgi:hypothetical protein